MAVVALLGILIAGIGGVIGWSAQDIETAGTDPEPGQQSTTAQPRTVPVTAPELAQESAETCYVGFVPSPDLVTRINRYDDFATTRRSTSSSTHAAVTPARSTATTITRHRWRRTRR